MGRMMRVLLALLMLLSLASCGQNGAWDESGAGNKSQAGDVGQAAVASQSIPEDDGQGEPSILSPVEWKALEFGPELLAQTLAKLDEDTEFYSGEVSGVPLASPEGITPGITFFGRSAIYTGSLTYRFPNRLESVILQSLQAIDPADFEMVDSGIVQEEPYSSGRMPFSGFAYCSDGSTYQIDVFLCGYPRDPEANLKVEGSEPTAVVLRLYAVLWEDSGAALCSGEYVYYLGTYDPEAYEPLEGIMDECRASTEVMEDTAIITAEWDAGTGLTADGVPRVTTRWINAEIVNIIDGTTLLSAPLPGADTDESSYDVRVEIGGDVYFLDTANALVMHERDGELDVYQIQSDRLSPLVTCLWGAVSLSLNNGIIPAE